MSKTLKKIMAVLMAVAMLVISAITVSASSFPGIGQASPLSLRSYWSIIISLGTEDSDYVKLLEEGKDSGITFHCTTYFDGGDSSFYGEARLVDSRIGPGHVDLKSNIDSDTVWFTTDWYRYSNGGEVEYYVKARNYDRALEQYIGGYAL